MAAAIHTDNDTGETTKLSLENISECNSWSNWRQNLQPEDTDMRQIHILQASNPNTSISVLDSLANEDSPVLLERIAENPNTSRYTLSKLAFHENPRVRAAVAENSVLPEQIMQRLANDIHPDVRLRLAESYLVPRSILQVLAEDDNPYVQMRAKKTIDRLNQPMTVSLSSNSI